MHISQAMSLSLDEILQLTWDEMPNPMTGLELNKDKIQTTLDALSLQKGEEYLSLGIGKNILPFIVAMHGVNVTGLDTDPEVLKYQSDISEKFSSNLQSANGSFTVYNFNFDDPYATQHVNGFETPPVGDFYNRFDIVECVFFNHREGESDLAQIELNFGRQEARYFVSTPGGLIGREDRIVTSLIDQIKMLGGNAEVTATDLYSSNAHNWPYGVVVKSS